MFFSVDDVKADLLTKIVLLWKERRIRKDKKERIIGNLDEIARRRWCRKR